ncbi:MAG: release factor glutamine methyltransferase HemK [Rhodobacteraceae bacterium HLUCCO18]|nr:MAG: release factor glutamine methyltransferase HemK [Rhodobacteraceae bacterium HLUCCO18]
MTSAVTPAVTSAVTPAVTLAEAARRLAAAGVPDPHRDVRRLFDWAFEQGRAAGGAQSRDAPNAATQEAFRQAIEARAARRPVSRITGLRAFWKHDFTISDAVLDPRPDTETLVELALRGFFGTVLDLGTGSGCILLSLLAERPGATGLGTDISAEALRIARENAARLGIAGATFVQSDWFGGVHGAFDLVVSNPPYIAAAEIAGLAPEVRHDPSIALTPGGDGLDAYRAIARGARRYLAPGGRLMVEIGSEQGAAVSALFEAAGLADPTVHADINGKDRVVSACRATQVAA